MVVPAALPVCRWLLWRILRRVLRRIAWRLACVGWIRLRGACRWALGILWRTLLWRILWRAWIGWIIGRALLWWIGRWVTLRARLRRIERDARLSAIGVWLAHRRGSVRILLPADEEGEATADPHAEERLDKRADERHRKRGYIGWMKDPSPPVDENRSYSDP